MLIVRVCVELLYNPNNTSSKSDWCSKQVAKNKNIYNIDSVKVFVNVITMANLMLRSYNRGVCLCWCNILVKGDNTFAQNTF